MSKSTTATSTKKPATQKPETKATDAKKDKAPVTAVENKASAKPAKAKAEKAPKVPKPVKNVELPIETMKREDFEKVFKGSVINADDLTYNQVDPKPIAILDYKKQGNYYYAFFLFHVKDAKNVIKDGGLRMFTPEYFAYWHYMSKDDKTKTWYADDKNDPGYAFNKEYINKMYSAINKK